MFKLLMSKSLPDFCVQASSNQLENKTEVIMQIKRTISVSLLTLAMVVVSCNRVPLTGRKQLNLIPSAQMNSLSADSYQSILSQSQVVTNTEEAKLVQTTGTRIEAAVEQYLRQNKMLDKIDGFEWRFNLVQDDLVNAFCMPGGRVVFYTGIMPICEDEAGVAVVMVHEIAHAIAKHGNERMSQGLVQQLGGVALSVALRDQPQQTQALFYSAYGVGSQIGVMLPFSRLHESEADKLGLIFMAMAGYDPREAPKFWERMRARSGGNQPPEFLSTHPSHNTRISDLNEFMPEALKYYKP
jgi:predicted Zn-dependent protease